jgi:hypothetical protein
MKTGSAINRRTFMSAVGLGVLAAPFVASAQDTRTGPRIGPGVVLPAPGTWAALPHTALASVIWRDRQNRTVNDIKGAHEAWTSSLKQWVGAAYRYDTDEMVLPVCGGHAGGASNEVWTVDVANGLVRRDFDPTLELIPTLEVRGPSHYVDTRGIYGPVNAVYPASRHTYNGLVHIPGTNLIWVAGGCPWAVAAGSKDVFLFDMKTKTWSLQDQDPLPHRDLGIAAAWDSIRQRILFIDYGEFWEWVPSRPAGQRARRLMALAPDTMVQYRTALFDERRNRLVLAGVKDNVTGASQVLYWEMTALHPSPSFLVSPSSGALPNWCVAPGFDLDYDNDRYLLIVQGDGLYWIRPTTGSVTFEPTTGAPPPITVDWHGSFGRVRYSRNLKCIISVQDMVSGTWLCRPAPPSPSANETAPTGKQR